MKKGDIIIYQNRVCIVSSIHESGNPNLHVFGVQGEPDARWNDCPPEPVAADTSSAAPATSQEPAKAA